MAELTLPDYLRAGLDLVFVGINPGLSSAKAGHYFHSAVNRFWPAVTRAGIFDPPLSAETDSEALAQGVGFTDLVKRATPSVSGLRVADYRAGAASLKERLTTAAPAIVCFNGITAYRNYMKYAEGDGRPAEPGPQPEQLGSATVFVVPSPSPANAAVSLDELVCWYGKLAGLLRAVRADKSR